jgi:uncharacterized protein (TIGR02118 family)
MHKQVVLIRGRAQQDRAQFQAWYRDWAMEQFAADLGLERWVVNLDGRDPSAPQRYDVVSEIWGSNATLAAAEDALRQTGRADVILAYDVEEWCEKGEAPEPGNMSPGVKVIGCVAAFVGMDLGKVLAHWNAHVPLALDIHVGISRYVRNWVTRRPHSEAPDYFGFPMLYFPTEKDFRERYFRSEEARALHAADIGQFVGSAVKLTTTEHVLARA